jgi:hypothetical protein
MHWIYFLIYALRIETFYWVAAPLFLEDTLVVLFGVIVFINYRKFKQIYIFFFEKIAIFFEGEPREENVIFELEHSYCRAYVATIIRRVLDW